MSSRGRPRTPRPVNLAPGYDGRREPITATVDDPFAPGQREVVVMNARESTLATLRSRGCIGEAQARAGDCFRQIYEAMGERNGAIDPSRTPVDTSGPGDASTDARLDAGRELTRIKAQLAPLHYGLVRAICGEGKSTAEVLGGDPTKHECRKLLRELRIALDKLARLFGLA